MHPSKCLHMKNKVRSKRSLPGMRFLKKNHYLNLISKYEIFLLDPFYSRLYQTQLSSNTNQNEIEFEESTHGMSKRNIAGNEKHRKKKALKRE